MAQGKKSFVLYSDMLQSIEHLTNEEKGILFNHLLEYVNDLKPILNDRLILTAWKPIELSLKRDLVKFEEVKSKRSDAGKRSAELRALKLSEQNPTNSTSVESVEQSSTNPTVSDSVIVSVNDSVILLEKETKVDWEKLKEQFNEITGKNTIVVNDKTKKQILARLKEGYTKHSIVDAITNCYNDEYHIESGHKYLTLEFISRPDKMEKFSTMQEYKKKPKKEDKI